MTIATLLRAAALMPLMLFLAGCATLSQDQCQSGDWGEIGYVDGSYGRARTQLAKHRDACAKYGTYPDAVAYDAGRRRGLRSYCTPQSGLAEGRAGHAYQGVCSGPDERAFLAEYRYGKAIHDAEQALEETERAIARAEKQLASDKTSADERNALREELKRLDDRHRAQSRELRRLQRPHAPQRY